MSTKKLYIALMANVDQTFLISNSFFTDYRYSLKQEALTAGTTFEYRIFFFTTMTIIIILLSIGPAQFTTKMNQCL